VLEWDKKEKSGVAKTSQQILDKLKISGRLPSPKGVALQVIELTQRDEVTNHDLVRLIGADPALSQRVVKAANTLLGHVSRPVVTIHDAVTVLGMRALRQLVLGIALVADYRHGPCARFDYTHFWYHSLLTAIAARQLAQRANLMAVEEVFVLGLLGQIGQLALATVYPQPFSALLEHGDTEESLREGERGQFDFDHAEVSAAMLADMHFPVMFQNLARDYRSPQTSKAAEGTREWQLLRTLNLAGLLAVSGWQAMRPVRPRLVLCVAPQRNWRSRKASCWKRRRSARAKCRSGPACLAWAICTCPIWLHCSGWETKRCSRVIPCLMRPVCMITRCACCWSKMIARCAPWWNSG